MTRIVYDPPIDARVGCRNCGDNLLCVARVIDGLQIRGLNQYEWIHDHGSAKCRPTTTAQPFDGWQATGLVEAALSARAAAEDALEAALEAATS